MPSTGSDPETEMEDHITNPEAETLRDKVSAAKDRLAERTANAKPVQTVKGLIEEHPVASVAAGILLGALVARALPSTSRKGRDTANGLRKGAAGLAAVAGQLAVEYATKAREAGREGMHKIEEVGGSVGGKLAEVGGVVGERLSEGSGEAKRKAGDLAEIARAAALEASEIALRKINELSAKVKG